MIFTETRLAGAFIIEPEPHRDERGAFARTWCRREWEARGLDARLAQCNVSFNKKRGTLRGLHYQAAPYAEARLVRCTRGAVYDVIVDLRPAAPGFGQWVGVVLSADAGTMLWVPAGFAHGFQTLEDATEVVYQMTEFYVPEAARGLRWDDPRLGILWPPAERTISDRDRSWPDFVPGAVGSAA